MPKRGKWGTRRAWEGRAYGRLEVLHEETGDNGLKSRVMCLCECGTKKSIHKTALEAGTTESCGCLRAEVKRKRRSQDGGTSEGRPHPVRAIWNNMMARCYNKNNQAHQRYGGRGIVVDSKWHDFDTFFNEFGISRPSNEHSIDRIDNDGNYEPGNVRWATIEEQANNKRNNVNLTFYGKTMTLTQWSRISQVKEGTIRRRLKIGLPQKEAVWAQPGYKYSA